MMRLFDSGTRLDIAGRLFNASKRDFLEFFMKPLTDKKAIADFKKKHLEASRDRWIKIAQKRAKKFKEPDLESLLQAVKRKKKPHGKGEKEICEAIERIHDMAENVEELGKTIAELRAPTRPIITKIEKPIGGLEGILNMLAAGVLLGLLTKRTLSKIEKEKD